MRGGSGDRGQGVRGEGGRGGDRPQPPSEEELIKKYDKDGDGKLNEEEREAARKAMEEDRARQGGGERPQRSTRGFSSMRAMFSLGRLTLPHMTMEKLKGTVADIQRTEEEGKVVYTVALTKDGAESLSSGAARFGRRWTPRSGRPSRRCPSRHPSSHEMLGCWAPPGSRPGSRARSMSGSGIARRWR